MRTRYSFVDPGVIVGAIVTIIILAVAVYAFFVTTENIPKTTPAHGTSRASNYSYKVLSNTTSTGGTIFNIMGIVITIGAIMMIVGIVYQYIR